VLFLFLEEIDMSEQTKNGDTIMPDAPDHESLRSRAIEDVARRIAVLVVRQHRRLSTRDGKKSDESTVYHSGGK
jgi:hypothetical protein